MIVKTRSRWGWLVGAMLLATPLVSAQEEQPDRHDESTKPRAKKEPKPLNIGIQLTPQLLDSLLDKAAQRLVKDYGFDEYQHERVRQLLHEQVPKFLKRHQAELQGLLNEYLETLAAEEPPEPEFAADWAERALPMVAEFRETVTGFSEGMREFMTDDQQVLLDGYLAVFETGTRFATGRLEEFAAGGFDPEIHWPRSKQFKKIDRAQMQQLRQEMEDARMTAMAGPRRPPRRSVAEAAAAPDAKLAADAKVRQARPEAKASKDEWTRYVEAFIQRYQLNDEQKQKAHSFLRQQLDRRDHYLLRKVREMERIETMFSSAKTDEQRKLAESAYQKLFAPTKRMFAQLKEKLDTLPTRAQRRAAALSEKKERRPRGPEPNGSAGKRRP